MYLHNDRRFFEDIIREISNQTKNDTAVIEKDYYVTMILKLLSQKSVNCVFKGGTSLSKCFHVIDRFSEDIDITFTEHVGAARRKKLKYNILKSISDELHLPIQNWNSIESNKDYNCYIFSYEPIEGYVTESLYPGIKLETVLSSYSFPIEIKPVDSYVCQFLEKENKELIKEFDLQPFDMKVQSMSRTFIDKVFALCDYYMQGKSRRYSRHLYDVYKLYPIVNKEENIRLLITEVRKHRSRMQVCPSAREGVDVPDIIRAFCISDFFKEDYSSITGYFLGRPIPYEKTIETLIEIAENGMFE